jgi:formylglycine-generating enzyme required for sulfatase activity
MRILLLGVLCLWGVVGQATDTSSRWTNSLGMIFVSVPGCEARFSIWETRCRDFVAFVEAAKYETDEKQTALPHAGKAIYDWRRSEGDAESLHPVTWVSWEDAQEFCRWLTAHEQGQGLISKKESYRLPKDAEWSAAVGKGLFPWSEVFPPHPLASTLTNQAQSVDERRFLPPPEGAGNYAGQEALQAGIPGLRMLKGYKDEFARTAPVGQFIPNAYGIYDMGGNVWEWCEDWFRRDMISKELESKLPYSNRSDDSHTCRVLRGASWVDSNPAVMRSDCRMFEFPDHRSSAMGFRAVLSKEPAVTR